MSKSRISRGGIAPPQGLIRPALSSSATSRPAFARTSAAIAPAGPPPTTTTSNTRSAIASSCCGKVSRFGGSSVKEN
jgi:hypothetical protein